MKDFYAQPVKRRKRRKPARSAISKKMAALQDQVRRCEVCAIQTDGVSSLCDKHRKRRRKYGSTALVRRPLLLQDYEHLVLAARRYLRHHRPPANIIEAMQSFLVPADALPFDRRYLAPRKMLRREMAWWGDPKSRKRWRTKWQSDYSPFAHLAVLAAVVAKIEELDGRGFPDDAEQLAIMNALVRMYLRPSGRAVNVKATRAAPPGVIIYRGKSRSPVTPTVLRLLVQRWKHQDRSDLRMFVYQTAKDVLGVVREKRESQNRKLITRTAPIITKRTAVPTAPPAPPQIAPPAPPPTPKKFERVNLTRYPKPTYRVGGCSIPELRTWEENQRLIRQYPEGFYYKEVAPDA